MTGADEHPAAPPAGRGGPPPLWRMLWMDLSPLRASPDFRLLLGSGAITMLGSFVTYVAIPAQIKQLTGSYVAVGLVAAAEFLPMILFGLYGGALADAVDRKRMAVLCEVGMLLASVGLLANARCCPGPRCGRCT